MFTNVGCCDSLTVLKKMYFKLNDLFYFQVESIEDIVKQCLEKISKLDLSGVTDAQRNEYKKRKLIIEV